MSTREQHEDRFDQAVAARLRKLGATPVDTTTLDRRLRQAIPRRRPMVLRLMRPLTAVAASITILAVLAATLLTTSSGEVLASPAQMAQVHQDIVANRIPVTRVNSIDEAGKVLSQQWPGTPNLPRPPESHVMACCMKSIKDKRVACVLLNNEGTPVTMTVAKSSDMRLPKGTVIAHNGVDYHVQSTSNLNMVSTERNGRWVCLIGETSSDRLMQIAERLQF